MDYSHPELADRLAADYVAGTLRGPARRRFESLLPAHPLLRQAVRDGQTRLMPLTVSLDPQKPPAAVWQGIQARIGGGAAARAAKDERGSSGAGPLLLGGASAGVECAAGVTVLA